MAVPLHGRGGEVVAAMNISAPLERGSVDEITDELLPALREAAGRAGGRPARPLSASDRVQALPASATPAATANVHGIPALRATTPSRIGPAPRPRSRNALTVPEAAPRSEGGTEANTAEKKAGVLKETPTAITATPAVMPSGVVHVAATTSPVAIAVSAAAPSGSAGSRSGTRAKTTRQVTTTAP
jgi:hypothetical protein